MKGKNRKKLGKPQLPKRTETSGKAEENREVKAAPSSPQEPVGQSAGSRFLRLTGILCLIFALCGLSLGLADWLTADRIAENQGSRNMGQLEEVLPYGENYRELRYSGEDSSIQAVYEAPGAGWVFQVSPADSYSGVLTLMVGVDVEGRVTGVAVTETQESDGLGLRASEPEFRDQFVGKSDQVRLTADSGDINAISGATVTSRAVCAGVNSALRAAGTLG